MLVEFRPIGGLLALQVILTMGLNMLEFRQWYTECPGSIQIKLKIQMEIKETDLAKRILENVLKIWNIWL